MPFVMYFVFYNVDDVCCCPLGQVALENEISISTGLFTWLNKEEKKIIIKNLYLKPFFFKA